MLCLTLKQPWATLLVLGTKIHETRSWKPAICPGLLGITSSKSFPPLLKALCAREPFRTLLARHNLGTDTLPLGCLLGTVIVEEILHTEDLVGTREPTALERTLGDFTPGRYAWRCSHPTALAIPLPIQGNRGLFKMPTISERMTTPLTDEG